MVIHTAAVIHRSIVLTALVPGAAAEIGEFEKAVKLFKARGVDTVEFFCDLGLAGKYGEILKRENVRGIFLAAAMQKKNKLWLSDTDEEKRYAAVRETLRCVRAAQKAGCIAVLITSGITPVLDDMIPTACSALEKSVWQIMIETPKYMQLLLEPGDRQVDSKQLIGPTELAVIFARRMQSEYPNFSLTMDTSHIAQLSEKPEEALKKARWVSRHIHLANCILDLGHPLYGDKHPFFDNVDGVYSSDRLKEIYCSLGGLYDSDEITVALEVIGRGGADEDTAKLLEEENWFFDR